ncbi:hypothetical protein [Kribbella sp. NPDC055071]
MNDPGFAITLEERRRLLEATASAARFFRMQLLKATGGWPVRYLKDAGAEHVMAAESPWRVGYAPEGYSGLVDHLRSEGFDYSTMVRSGLVTWTDDGDAIDRFRDRIVLVSRDRHLLPVGFVGIDPEGRAQPLITTREIHRPVEVLVGIEEQLDLLRGGAVPVIVQDPVDAIVLSNLSREMDREWVAIPDLGQPLSREQARLLRKFTLGEDVTLIVRDDANSVQLTSAHVRDLTMLYDRIRAVVLSSSPRKLASEAPGELQKLLITAEPAMTIPLSTRFRQERGLDLEPPDRGPRL